MVTTPNYDLDIDTTLGGNNASDYVVPSQKAIKAYVDNSTGGNVMWGNIAGNISNQTDLQDALDDKQDTLVSGSNIKTINSTSILGSGNISVATSAQGALADTALQPNDNISELTNNAGYITSSALAPYALSADLSTVATSGSYNDLSNKPTIPSEVTESTVSGWGFTKNTGTVTSVNNIAPVNGNVTLPIPDTALWGNISGTLSNQTDLQTALNGKQAALISGTNIKTINGNSLLGSGDITIQSGASYSAVCPAITPVDGVATWVVTHNLDTQAVVTALYSNGNKVEHNTLVTSNNAITVTFKASSAVTAGSYKIVVLASGGSGGGSADDTYTSNVKNYTVVGAITENDGVLSGFTSNTNYAYSSSTIPLGTDFEFYTKFTATSAFSAQHNIASSRNTTVFAVMVTNNGTMQVNSGTSAGWGTVLNGSTVLSPNTTYYVKVVYKNNTYSFYLSTDGINYTQEATGAYTETMPNITLNIGMGRSNTSPFNGSIDAKETYFIVNGVEVWRAIDNSILTNLSPVTDYYISGSSWYKETFSDSTRTKRIWLEQGGVASSSTATINLLKSFSNTNYVVTGGASNKTTSSFTLTSNANWVAIGV